MDHHGNISLPLCIFFPYVSISSSAFYDGPASTALHNAARILDGHVATQLDTINGLLDPGADRGVANKSKKGNIETKSWEVCK